MRSVAPKNAMTASAASGIFDTRKSATTSAIGSEHGEITAARQLDLTPCESVSEIIIVCNGPGETEPWKPT